MERGGFEVIFRIIKHNSMVSPLGYFLIIFQFLWYNEMFHLCLWSRKNS